ncbi:hypothetical protein EJD97_019387 [Solanum chilense]|uniref:Ubiquitin-like protease family profile domain-containing protein n=1 Tax=Solanum chilense TaxID=4083 RepID=A0A6N2B003_SOLCI|nr:hypothetical protein EJD97_019387 [Solanum chilense]
MEKEVTEYTKLNIYRRPSIAKKEEVIKVTGAKRIRPTPRGMYWIDAKSILTVMNILGNHFVIVEILLHEGLINVYDCNLVITGKDKFFTLIQLVFELMPKLLKQSGTKNHLPEKVVHSTMGI